jgi:ABC-type Na+ transport system ATPase subunit NatA
MIKSVTLNKFRGLDGLTVPLSSVTMLTGTNGVGKTSVLEGLYCLFSETRLDVSPLARYSRTVGIVVNQSVNGLQGIGVRQAYNYKLFWDECPSYGETSSNVTADSDDGLEWSWEYKKAKISDLDSSLTRDASMMKFAMDSNSDIALFTWRRSGEAFEGKHQKNQHDEENRRVQILNRDGALYLFPPEIGVHGFCRYLDFASIRAMPQELTYQTAKKLVMALRLINPDVVDIRISKIENGLSAVLDKDVEFTIGTLGNGVVAWASALVAIFELDEVFEAIDEMNVPVMILIDEIGAGVHYGAMLDVWKYIKAFADQNPKIQFVVTSHSDDCVRAFCEAFSESDSAQIVRLHKQAIDDRIRVTEYKKRQFENIASGDWEVRG